MSVFAVRLKGTGCRVKVQRWRWGFLLRRPATQSLGFYTLGFVEAASPREAGEKAVVMVHNELKELIVNKSDQPWSVSIEEVSEEFSQRPEGGASFGFSWFPEDVK